MTDQPCCACRRIAYETRDNGDGTVSGYWECLDCGGRFVRAGSAPTPDPRDAVTRAARHLNTYLALEVLPCSTDDALRRYARELRAALKALDPAAARTCARCGGYKRVPRVRVDDPNGDAIEATGEGHSERHEAVGFMPCPDCGETDTGSMVDPYDQQLAREFEGRGPHSPTTEAPRSEKEAVPGDGPGSVASPAPGEGFWRSLPLPCPFCGLIPVQHALKGFAGYGSPGEWIDDAVRAWNRRTRPRDGEVAALHEEVDAARAHIERLEAALARGGREREEVGE